MFDEFKQIIEEIKKLDDPAKAAAQTGFVTWCVARVAYYLIAGIVAWALGRRIVQGTFAALREARRSND